MTPFAGSGFRFGNAICATWEQSREKELDTPITKARRAFVGMSAVPIGSSTGMVRANSARLFEAASSVKSSQIDYRGVEVVADRSVPWSRQAAASMSL